MATFAFVVPVLPGKEETDLETMQRFATGEENDAYDTARRSLGFQREAIWHQQTPDGTLAIVLWEAEDIEQALPGSRRPTSRSTSDSASSYTMFTASTSRTTLRPRSVKSSTIVFSALPRGEWPGEGASSRLRRAATIP